jgi:tetratricopeptide (TPR) repeat protein
MAKVSTVWPFATNRDTEVMRQSLSHWIRALVALLPIIVWTVPTAMAESMLELDIRQLDRQLLRGPVEFLVQSRYAPLEELELEQFQPLTASDINQGITSDIYWLRARLRNTGDQAVSWLIFHETSYLDNLIVYIRDEGSDKFERTALSDRQPFHTRPVDYRRLAFPHTTAAHGYTDVYLQLFYDKADSLTLRHAAFFTEVASAFEARVRQHGFEAVNLGQFRADYENVRAALHWAQEAGEKELFARLAASFGVYSYVGGPYEEARQWLEVALADPPEDPVLDGLVARSLGMVCFAQGDHRRAEAAHERAISLFRSAGETELEAKSLNNAAGAAIHLGEYHRGRELLFECRERARALGEGRWIREDRGPVR